MYISPGEFLPTVSDLKCLEKEFVVLFARILVKHILNMDNFKKAVVFHIPHQYRKELTEPSEQVFVTFVCMYT